MRALKGKEAEVEETLRWAASRVPWAVVGHSEEIEELMRKDAAGLVAVVAERKRQYEASPGTA